MTASSIAAIVVRETQRETVWAFVRFILLSSMSNDRIVISCTNKPYTCMSTHGNRRTDLSKLMPDYFNANQKILHVSLKLCNFRYGSHNGKMVGQQADEFQFQNDFVLFLIEWLDLLIEPFNDYNVLGTATIIISWIFVRQIFSLPHTLTLLRSLSLSLSLRLSCSTRSIACSFLLLTFSKSKMLDSLSSRQHCE